MSEAQAHPEGLSSADEQILKDLANRFTTKFAWYPKALEQLGRPDKPSLEWIERFEAVIKMYYDRIQRFLSEETETFTEENMGLLAGFAVYLAKEISTDISLSKLMRLALSVMHASESTGSMVDPENGINPYVPSGVTWH